MQASTLTPQTPAPPTGTPVQVEVGPGQLIQIPHSRQEINALRARRSELSNQLSSATDRRNEIAKELTTAAGPVRAGLEQRLAVLDKRIVQLETDIATTGQALTSAPAGLLAAADGPPRAFGVYAPQAVSALTGLFVIFVLAPLSFGVARAMWRRARLGPAPRTEADSTARLERIEQAVDAIAIEVERISEAQRFTTRILGEGQAFPALGAAQSAAEPIRLPDYAAARVKREGT
jgi:hypothetical protein